MHIIQVVRDYLGITQAQLAKAAGLSQADICEMEIDEKDNAVNLMSSCILGKQTEQEGNKKIDGNSDRNSQES